MNTADYCAEGLVRYAIWNAWNEYKEVELTRARVELVSKERADAWQRWRRHQQKCIECGGQR